MRYAYAITAALLTGGATATLLLGEPLGAQVAQNAPQNMAAMPPKPGAPMSFADLAAKLQPAVVNISTTQRVQVQQNNPFQGSPFEDLFKRFNQPGTDSNGQPVTREATSLGSGFVISPDGYVVTNNHVISAGNPNEPGVKGTVSSITVTFPDRREYKARVVGKDANSDLAVLKIEATNLPFVNFGDSTHARVGDWVLAIGNPFGLGGTVTAGIVSALHRGINGGGAYDRYIQTDASINMGNSGGPMFDLSGNVIGINSAIFSPSGGNVGIGFAIPAEEAKPVIDTLKRGEKIKRGYLGIAIQPVSDDIADSLGLPHNRGEIVSRVEPGYAAARAGLRQGDVILRVNNVDVTPDNTLSFIVSNLPIGTRTPIDLMRDGKRMSLMAVVGERPPEDQLAGELNGDQGDNDNGGDGSANSPAPVKNALGLSLQVLSPEIARQLQLPSTAHGLVVASVDPSSDASDQGLKRGDVLLSINQRPTTTLADAAAAIQAAKAANRPSVLLLVQRGGGVARYVGVQIKK